MYSLEKHPLVDCDLREAALWYGRRDIELANRLIEATERAIRLAVSAPLQHSQFDENIRRFKVPGFPYLVLYAICEHSVYILSIVHGAREHGNLTTNRGDQP